MAKEYLSLKGLRFTERNVSQDKEGRAELLALGLDATPVVVIGDEVIDGLDPAAIDEALAKLEDRTP